VSTATVARTEIGSAVTKAGWRILPLIATGYLISFVDRFNVGFAATQMNADLGFSATVYGLGGGLFFSFLWLCSRFLPICCCCESGRDAGSPGSW
jgi:hypothetical protein